MRSFDALAERAHEPVLEVDRAPVQAGRLADAQARAVHQLDERAVAHRARRRAVGGLDQPLGLGRRERARQRAGAARQLRARRPGLSSRAPSSIWCRKKERSGGDPPRDRRRGEAGRAHLGQPALELLGRRLADRALSPRRELREIAPVRVHGARRPPVRAARGSLLDRLEDSGAGWEKS